MGRNGVLRQRKWTKDELIAEGFTYYPIRKQLVMARPLPEEEAPKAIPYAHGVLIAETGHVICYRPGQKPQDHWDDYLQWPVEPAIFHEQYKPWDEPDWQPNPAEKRLLENGCKPYYKVTGVWAKRLDKSLYVQSLESLVPVLAPPGAWLCIGEEGEPYVHGENFTRRYIVPEENRFKRLLAAITRLLKRRQ